MFAGQASIALANVEAHRALWARAETDALTGLRNRGAFELDLERLLADSVDRARPAPDARSRQLQAL